MELLLYIGGFILILAIVFNRIQANMDGRGSKSDRDAVTAKAEKRRYAYTPRNSLMTRREGEFFWKLQNVTQDRYFIFPQVHLSSLLDHRIKGQVWSHAFRHINGKSVDYVLCSKTTLQPVYAVELDDRSHDKADRIERDIEVEHIFQEANIPLVRFRDYRELSEEDIARTFSQTHKLANSETLS